MSSVSNTTPATPTQYVVPAVRSMIADVNVPTAVTSFVTTTSPVTDPSRTTICQPLVSPKSLGAIHDTFNTLPSDAADITNTCAGGCAPVADGGTVF